jgi:hypothetical protein
VPTAYSQNFGAKHGKNGAKRDEKSPKITKYLAAANSS